MPKHVVYVVGSLGFEAQLQFHSQHWSLQQNYHNNIPASQLHFHFIQFQQ